MDAFTHKHWHWILLKGVFCLIEYVKEKVAITTVRLLFSAYLVIRVDVLIRGAQLSGSPVIFVAFYRLGSDQEYTHGGTITANVAHRRRDIDWDCHQSAAPITGLQGSKRRMWLMGWCCVLYVCTSICKGESLWGSCEYVTTSGLVLLTQRDTLLAFNMLFPCWWGRVLAAPKEKKFSITNCTAVLFFFLSADMKERACLSFHTPSTRLSCPKEPGVFLEQHLPLSFFCHKISKRHPWKLFSNHNEAIIWGFVMVWCP